MERTVGIRSIDGVIFYSASNDGAHWTGEKTKSAFNW